MSKDTKKWLFNPFEFIAGEKSLLLGSGVIILLGGLGYFGNMYFAGLVSARSGPPNPLWFFLLKNMIVWLLASTMIFAAGVIISKSKIRVIDVFGTQAMARWPMLIIAFLAVVFPVYEINERVGEYLLQSSTGQEITVVVSTFDAVMFVIMTIIALLSIIWAIALSWNAYKISCNVKGGKAVIAYIIALLVTEVLSQLILSRIIKAI